MSMCGICAMEINVMEYQARLFFRLLTFPAMVFRVSFLHYFIRISKYLNFTCFISRTYSGFLMSAMNPKKAEPTNNNPLNYKSSNKNAAGVKDGAY